MLMMIPAVNFGWFWSVGLDVGPEDGGLGLSVLRLAFKLR